MPTTLQQTTAYREILTGDATFMTTLLVMLVDVYGTEVTEWSQATILMELEEDFDVTMPPTSVDRVMAGIALLTTDAFYKSLPDFITLCNVLSGDAYDPRNWDPADSGEIAWGVTEALIFTPPDDGDDEPFIDDIRHYIAAVLDAEGIINPPDILRIALRPDNPADKIQGEFSDDPGMFAAIYQFEDAKTEDLNKYLHERLIRLLIQLQGVPVQNGSTKDVVQNALNHIQSMT